MSVVSCEGSGDSSLFVEVLPCANREREERVLIRDADGGKVALMILEVSLEILEVLILPVGQGSCTTRSKLWEVQLQSPVLLHVLQQKYCTCRSEAHPLNRALWRRVGPQIKMTDSLTKCVDVL